MVNRVLDSIMGNQGSTGYLVIQLSVIVALPRLRHHTSYFFVWSCVLSYLGLTVRPASAPVVLDRENGHARYPSKTHALHDHT